VSLCLSLCLFVCAHRTGQSDGATESAGLDIVGPVWQGWTMTDDLRTGVIWLVIDGVDQQASRMKK